MTSSLREWKIKLIKKDKEFALMYLNELLQHWDEYQDNEEVIFNCIDLIKEYHIDR